MSDAKPELKPEQKTITAQIITAPAFYASSLQVQWAGNDVMITFARPRPLGPNQALQEPVAIVHMSMLTVADLRAALDDLLPQIEAKHGKQETEFTKQIASKRATRSQQ
jgi:hypothetical protein